MREEKRKKKRKEKGRKERRRESLITYNNRHEDQKIESDLFETSCFGEFTDEDEARGRKLFKDWVNSLPEQERDRVLGELLDVEAAESCENDTCPCCGGKLESGGIVDLDDFEIEKDLGGGWGVVRDSPKGEKREKKKK